LQKTLLGYQEFISLAFKLARDLHVKQVILVHSLIRTATWQWQTHQRIKSATDIMRLEACMAMTIWITVFYLRCYVPWVRKTLSSPENGSRNFLQNTGICLPKYTPSHPKKALTSTATVPTSHKQFPLSSNSVRNTAMALEEILASIMVQ